MREGIQGLGWFIRRAAEPLALGRFYHAALGLPELREWDTPDRAGFMMHAGGDTVFEILRGNPPPPANPLDAACTPIFRTRGIETVLSRVKLAGGKILADEGANTTRTVFFGDPAGNICGLRESHEFVEAPPIAAPQEKDTSIAPDAVPRFDLPPDIEGLGWVRLRVEDPVPLSNFYWAAFGFETVDKPTYQCTRLKMGGQTLLELVPGRERGAAPTDRTAVADTWIMRVYDYLGLKAHMAVENVLKVTTLEFPGGWLDYYADPEGHVFGFQERKPPDPTVPDTTLPEDIAARRHWEGRF